MLGMSLYSFPVEGLRDSHQQISDISRRQVHGQPFETRRQNQPAVMGGEIIASYPGCPIGWHCCAVDVQGHSC